MNKQTVDNQRRTSVMPVINHVLQRAGINTSPVHDVPPIVHDVLRSPGQPLDAATRAFMEPRFGHDFSRIETHSSTQLPVPARLAIGAPNDEFEQVAEYNADRVMSKSGPIMGETQDFSRVRIHSDAKAAESAQKVNALAYTSGHDIVFGAGQYAPTTREGRRLIAHELTHVMQQENGIRRSAIQRYSGCSSTQDTTITQDHARARNMLSIAIAAVSSYNGTTPTKVFNALSAHFHGATSNAFATWINVNLRFLQGVTWMAGYECYTGGIFERFWACGANDLATTFWCVPGVDIRLCPSYFGQSPKDRSTTLIHEWVHKYGCNFDLGYEGEPGYSQNRTLTQLLNADSFSSFVRDVQ